MNATVSLDSIWTFLQSLSLTDSNKDWLADKLRESKTNYHPYTIEELDDRLFVAEEDFAAGNTYTTSDVLSTLTDFAHTL